MPGQLQFVRPAFAPRSRYWTSGGGQVGTGTARACTTQDSHERLSLHTMQQRHWHMNTWNEMGSQERALLLSSTPDSAGWRKPARHDYHALCFSASEIVNDLRK